MQPPESFLQKMQQLLPSDEYKQFVACYGQKPQTGLRLNALKVDDLDAFGQERPFTLSSIPHLPHGYRVLDGEPGKHPYHAAGLYYMQEPAAMTVASLLNPQAGDWVLDLAAAPGGKTTHIASLMNDTGLLVANDVHRGRAKELASNLERWGVRNSLITSNTPAQLADTFGTVFDRVLVDAPCSGEGMFRKLGAFDWSEDLVTMCAMRQKDVLQTAVRLLRPHGTLVYSTCTFSPEENEGAIASFLQANPDFELIEPHWHEGFAHGNPDWADGDPQLSKTIRLWPHHFAGEGHFIAILQRHGDIEIDDKPRLRSVEQLSRKTWQVWQTFSQSVLTVDWQPQRFWLSSQGHLSYLPESILDTNRLTILRHGLPLGEIRKGHFKPSHQLALALKPHEYQQSITFASDGEEIQRYLAGEDLPIGGVEENGWIMVTVDDWVIGWGKMVNGRLKNHYPKGLRQPLRL